jgi:hypothetical protein
MSTKEFLKAILFVLQKNMSKNKPDTKRGEAAFIFAIILGLALGIMIKRIRVGILIGIVLGIFIVTTGWLRTTRK